MNRIFMSNKIYTLKRVSRRLLTGSPHKRSVFDRLYSRFWRKDDPLVIIDVGAHIGESCRRFKRSFPHCTIHSFEADAENFSKFLLNVERYSDVHSNNVGAGARAESRTFYRNVKSDTSSFIQVDPESGWAKKRSALHKVDASEFTQTAYDVEIITLDSYVEENCIDHVQLLKVDTQGFEDEVFMGARNTLKDQKVDVIETELIVGNAYKKALTFADLENILVPLGYRLFAIDRGGNLLDKLALSFNLIYVSHNFMAKVSDEIKQ